MWKLRGGTATDDALRRRIRQLGPRVTRIEIDNPVFSREAFTEFCLGAEAAGALSEVAVRCVDDRRWIFDCLRKVKTIQYLEIKDTDIDGAIVSVLNDWEEIRSLAVRECGFLSGHGALVTGRNMTGITLDGCSGPGNCVVSFDMKTSCRVQSVAMMGLDLRGYGFDLPQGLNNLSVSYRGSHDIDCIAASLKRIEAASYNTLSFRDTKVDNTWVMKNVIGLGAPIDSLALSNSQVVLDGPLADSLAAVPGLYCVHVDDLQGDAEMFVSRLRDRSTSVRSIIV